MTEKAEVLSAGDARARVAELEAACRELMAIPHIRDASAGPFKAALTRIEAALSQQGKENADG